MNMEHKICPFMQLPSGGQSPCWGERCALYIRDCCALADIANSLVDIAINTAVLE